MAAAERPDDRDPDAETVRMLAERLAERERELAALESELERIEEVLGDDAAADREDDRDGAVDTADGEIARLLDLAEAERERAGASGLVPREDAPPSRPATRSVLRDPRLDGVLERLDRLQLHVDHLRASGENLDRKVDRALEEILGHIRGRESRRAARRDPRVRVHALRLALMAGGLIVLLVVWIVIALT